MAGGVVVGALAADQKAPAPGGEITPEAREFFEKSVRPILIENCYACHGSKQQLGGLRFDEREAVFKGGQGGPIIVPGDLEKSRLIQAVRRTGDLKMPPSGKLPPAEIDALTRWVKMGAPWPQDSVDLQSLKGKGGHWAFRPLKRPKTPAVRDGAWVRDPLDAFILAKLEQKGLAPAPRADKRVLIRRASYDLIGLPPTPGEVEAFLADESPEAFAKVVDRLLASSHFGERWARHWLDLVRYAETSGHEYDFEKPNAWRYRDYLIRAFNTDVPYDQFVAEHVAGDLLKKPRRHPKEGFNESVIGTGFWWLGEGKHSPVDILEDEAFRVDNQIDVFSKTFLALTVSCARCHDHKFDPIPTRDYYGLAGYLQSSRFQDAFIDAPTQRAQALRKLRLLREKKAGLTAQATLLTKLALLSGVDELLHDAQGEVLSGGTAKPQNVTERVAAHLRKRALEDASDPLHLWALLTRQMARNGDAAFRDLRVAVAKELEAEQSRYRKFERESELFADFSSRRYEGWRVTGEAFGEGPTQGNRGEYQTNAEGLVTSLAAPGTAHSGLGSPKARGVLRSETFEIKKRFILYRMSGRASHVNVIVDGFQLIRQPLWGFLRVGLKDERRPRWFVQDMNKVVGHRAYIEIIDPGDGFIAVAEIRFADAPPPGEPPHLLLKEALGDDALEAATDLAFCFNLLTLNTALDWKKGRLGKLDRPAQRVALLNWLLQTPMEGGVLAEELQAPLAQFAAQVKELETRIKPSRQVLAMADGTGENEFVFVRGNHKELGEEAPRQHLSIMAGVKQKPPKEGSGRGDLARKMTDPKITPLLPRVMVNRVWQHLFGEPIVRTPDNFGLLGRRPTHPELLDHLSVEFVRQGWSLKKLMRRITLSSAYQMASRADPKADEADPNNLLLHKMPVRRLEAEIIRDAILAVSGRFDGKMYGPPVPPFLTPFMTGRGRPRQSGPLDGDGRRSIYLGVRRNFLSPFFLAFDYPIPFTTIGKRSVSTVPAQALTLMNNDFVILHAERWAKKTLAESSAPGERVNRLYLSAYGRPPRAGELSAALAFVNEQAERYAEGGQEQAWTDLCHVLLNAKEFIFIQ